MTQETTGSLPSPAAKLILDHPNRFKSGVRLMMRVWRNKEQTEGKRPGRTVITDSVESWDAAARKLFDEMIPGERIYASAEARDVDKAIRVFKERQLSHDYDSEPVRHAFYHECFTRWLSCLGAPQASVEKLFMFDCDTIADHALLTKDIREAARECDLPGKVLHSYPTKNGVHVLMSPFNPELLSIPLRRIRSTNALILVAWR